MRDDGSYWTGTSAEEPFPAKPGDFDIEGNWIGTGDVTEPEVKKSKTKHSKSHTAEEPKEDEKEAE